MAIIGRKIPPVAASVSWQNIVAGLRGSLNGQKEIERFSRELKEYFGVRHCYLVSSGKAALVIILKGLKCLARGRREVLIPAFTCFSVPAAIHRAGLDIKLCDVDPDSLGFNLSELSEIISGRVNVREGGLREQLAKPSEKILCVVPTHLYGVPADISVVRNLVQDNDIYIVEDAAQAMGAELEGEKLGTGGDVCFFSLGRGKVLSAVEGGVILTDNDDIARELEIQLESMAGYNFIGVLKLILMAMFLDIFQHPCLFWLPKLLPFLKIGETIYDPNFKIRRMSAFQAGMTAGWQKTLVQLKEKRVEKSQQWFSICGSIRIFSTYWRENGPPLHLIRFPVRIKDATVRKRILRKSEEKGMGIMPSYPSAICDIPEIKNNFSKLSFNASRKVSSQLVTLPIHSFVRRVDIIRVAKLFKDVFKEQNF